MKAGTGKVLVVIEGDIPNDLEVVWGTVKDIGAGSKIGYSMRDGDVAFPQSKAFKVREEEGGDIWSVNETDILAIEPFVVPREEPVDENAEEAEDILEETTEGVKNE